MCKQSALVVVKSNYAKYIENSIGVPLNGGCVEKRLIDGCNVNVNSNLPV